MTKEQALKTLIKHFGLHVKDVFKYKDKWHIVYDDYISTNGLSDDILEYWYEKQKKAEIEREKELLFEKELKEAYEKSKAIEVRND